MIRLVTFRRRTLVAVVLGVAALIDASPAQATDAVPAPTRIAVVNHAGPVWPMPDAMRNWNRNGRVRLVLTADCSAVRPCVVVRVESDPTRRSLLGFTVRPEPGRFEITFNQAAISGTPTDRRHLRRTIACHELGHVLLGPDHVAAGHGCLVGGLDGTRRYAGQMLLDRLAALAATPAWLNE